MILPGVLLQSCLTKASRSWARALRLGISPTLNFSRSLWEDWNTTVNSASNKWKSDPGYSRITIDYTLDPFKYNVVSSDDTDWLWNELFVDVIRYGRFTVSGTKYRNLVNEGALSTIPTFTCENPMTVEFGSQTYNLVRGKNYNANLVLSPGDNIMLFTGNGDVTVGYREVSL